jgi:hypothetical protein
VVLEHFHPAPSGATNQKMREHADKIIEKVSHADPRISLNFVRVDGDEGYNDYFEATLNLLIHFLTERSLGRHFAILRSPNYGFGSVTGFTS